MVLFVILAFKGIYYRIDGKQLIVYQMFIPRAYPIDRIRDIKPTKLALSAPATSLRHRLAITFDDPKVLKGRLPLIISPVRQSEFIAILKVINPDITVG